MHTEQPSVRSEQSRDTAQISRLHDAAFGEHGRTVNLIVDDLRPTIVELGGLSLVAEVSGEIVGHVMITMSLLDTASQLIPAPVLSPLAVLPEQQSGGIGGALLARALAAVADAGAPFVILEGDPRYYSRFGFRQAGDLGFRKPSLRIPDVAFQVALLPTYESWMIGSLVYAWPFWAHDAVGLRE